MSNLIYRLEVPYFTSTSEIDTLDLYLEGGDESPSGEQWVDTLEMLAEVTSNTSIIQDAIKVIKNLGTEEDGWQEYFPYLHCPNLPGQAIQCVATGTHPDHPDFGELKITLTWIRVFKPYLRALRELCDELRFIKDEDKAQLAGEIERDLSMRSD